MRGILASNKMAEKTKIFLIHSIALAGLMLLLALWPSIAMAEEPTAAPGAADLSAASTPNGARGYATPPDRSSGTATRLLPRLVLFPARFALYAATYPVRTTAGIFSSTGLLDKAASGFRQDRYFIPIAGIDPSLGKTYGFRAGHLNPFHNGSCVTYRAAYGGSKEYVAAITLRSRNPRQLGWSYRLTGKVETIPKNNYFGRGNSSFYKNRSFYLQERYLLLGTLSLALNRWQRWDLTVGIHRNQIQPAAGLEVGEKSIEGRFPSEHQSPGLWLNPQNIWGELALTLDKRNFPGRPTAGYWAEGFMGYARGAGDDGVNYVRYGGEGQAYLPLRAMGTLVMRIAGEEARSADPDPIKFSELIHLGGRSTLRGYVEDRFMENAGIMGTAEYRYPMTPFVEACFFADFGKVMPRLLDFNFEGVHRSWGAGLRFASTKHFFCRAYGAICDENYVINFTLESAFDREDRRERR